MLTASLDADSGDFFGNSVALSDDGSVLAVGASEWDGVNNDKSKQGGVYIYDKIGDTWNLRGSVLFPSDAGSRDYFGRSVALSSDGSVLAVGATGWDGVGSPTAYDDRGAVYIYDLDKVTDTRTQRGSVLTAIDAESSDAFGSSVALSSD